MLALLLLPSASAQAARTVRLVDTFQGRVTTATATVPDDWKRSAVGDHVKFIAPSSRRGCDHVLRLRLDLLYVANTVTAPDWVTSRLHGNGPVAGRGDRTDGYSWGVAARQGRRTAVGYGAFVAGSGRLGRIMAEVRATSDLTSACGTSQAGPARRRLTRVLQDLVLQAAKA